MYVNGNAHFVDQVNANNVNITGILTATGLDLSSTTGTVITGIVSATTLKVGAGSTVFFTDSDRIGIGTLSARAKLDIEGHTQKMLVHYLYLVEMYQLI